MRVNAIVNLRFIGTAAIAAGLHLILSLGAATAAEDSGRRGERRSVMPGGAELADLDPVTQGAFLLDRVREHEIARGLMESGLIPGYPANARCPKIDHIFGEPWRGPVHRRRSNATRHHGADIPAPDATPIIAIADGVVIAKYAGGGGFRGIELILRHAPEDTGLPVWVYTAYSHFKEMPELEVGQRVQMGEPLGPNGKTGVPSRRRGPHLHLNVFYSESEEFVGRKGGIVPVEGHYVDVVTLMRRGGSLDTSEMLELPETERRVPIPHRLTTGATVPADTKIIWPFACRPI